jgi:phage terminase small subunit
MPRKLTVKQQRFIAEYLVDYNGTQAAIRAGYPAPAAAQMASENLRKPEIRAAVDRALAALQARCDVSAERVLLELARVAYADVRGIFDAAGRLKQPKDYDAAIAAAVVGVEVATKSIDEGEVEYIHKIKLAPKIDALRALAQHLGLLKMQVTGPDGGAVPVRVVHQQLPT